jgi:hypothetical protein
MESQTTSPRCGALAILPSLSALGRACVDLGVEIRLTNLPQEFIERKGPRNSWLDDKLPLRKAQFDGGVVLETDFLGERLGDANGQTVAPALDARTHGNLQEGSIYNEYTTEGACRRRAGDA